MKKFKFRFSYFLILGIVGFLLQLISFFSFSDVSITSSNLMNKNTNKYFMSFIANNIVFIFATLLIIGLFVGFLIGKKKNKNILFSISTIGIIATESLLLIITVTYLIFTGANRTNLYLTTKSYMDVMKALIMVKMIVMMLSSAFLALFFFVIDDCRNSNKANRICSYITSASFALLFISLLVVMSTSLANYSYSMLTNLYEIKTFPPYKKVYPSMNGFTLAQFNRLTLVFADVESKGASNIYSISAGIDIFTLVIYLVSIVSSMVSFIIQLVQSYDLEKDNNLMEI